MRGFTCASNTDTGNSNPPVGTDTGSSTRPGVYGADAVTRGRPLRSLPAAFPNHFRSVRAVTKFQ